MVKNKNTRGRSHKSKSKTRKTGSQTKSSNDLTPRDDPVHIPDSWLWPHSEGAVGFPDSVYLLASVIFQNNHLMKPTAHTLVNYGQKRGLLLPEVKEGMQCLSYELAFNALKYQDLLEDIMTGSCFYFIRHIPDSQKCLVAVMLYDFQDRNFLPRKWFGEDFIQEVRDVENYLLRFKTKLAASLARCRVKHNLSSIECFLPESVKVKQERSRCLPLYGWVNTLKSSLDEVQMVLKRVGFSQVESIGQLEGQTFCQDPHCGDLLVFPARQKAELFSSKLLSEHKLIIQDKSCSLAPNVLRQLLTDKGDVLMVGCFSGLTAAHTASLFTAKHQANNNQSTVYACVSGHTDAQRQELQKIITLMGCTNVKQIPEVFQSLSSLDKRLEKVRAIMLTPRCSVSAVSNPVELILQENGDMNLLQDLSQGSVAPGKLEALVEQQKKDINHALTFPKVSVVVYSTRSSHLEENEEVVSSALKQAEVEPEHEGKKPKKPAKFGVSHCPFKPDDTKKTGSFFTLKPSEQSNGCFVAALTRQPVEVVKETPQDVLERAYAKGILDKIGCNKPTGKEVQGNVSMLTKSTRSCSSQCQNSVSVKSKIQETKSRNAVSVSADELVNRRKLVQGKARSLPCLQLSKCTVDFTLCKQENSYCSSTEASSSTETVTPVHNAATSTTTLHPAPPVAPVPRPGRAHQGALTPVVLVLPSIKFPDFFPKQHSRPGFSHIPDSKKYRTPAQQRCAARSLFSK